MTHKNRNKPNPDNRRDNVDKLQNMIDNTIENIDEAEEHLQFATEDEREQIKHKNKRRHDALDGFRAEIKDEAEHSDHNK